MMKTRIMRKFEDSNNHRIRDMTYKKFDPAIAKRKELNKAIFKDTKRNLPDKSIFTRKNPQDEK